MLTAASTSSLPQKNCPSKSPIKKEEVKLKAFGKSLQQKTKVFRRTMLRKK